MLIYCRRRPSLLKVPIIISSISKHHHHHCHKHQETQQLDYIMYDRVVVIIIMVCSNIITIAFVFTIVVIRVDKTNCACNVEYLIFHNSNFQKHCGKGKFDISSYIKMCTLDTICGKFKCITILLIPWLYHESLLLLYFKATLLYLIQIILQIMSDCNLYMLHNFSHKEFCFSIQCWMLQAKMISVHR